MFVSQVPCADAGASPGLLISELDWSIMCERERANQEMQKEAGDGGGVMEGGAMVGGAMVGGGDGEGSLNWGASNKWNDDQRKKRTREPIRQFGGYFSEMPVGFHRPCSLEGITLGRRFSCLARWKGLP